jgi:hypothetical protein
MLHFATHKALQSEETWASYMEIPTPRLEDAQRIAISNWCRARYQKFGPKGTDILAYSAQIEQHFTDDGELTNAELGAGFTCTTFVAEAFENHGCALVDRSTWPRASGNDVRIVRALYALFRLRHPDDRAHFDAAENTTDWTRLLAEQLCAAARLAPPTVNYKRVKRAAERLREDLFRAYTPLN